MTVYKHTTKQKKRGWLRGMLTSVVSLCVLTGLALLLIPGGPGPGIDGIRKWIFGTNGTLSGEFIFSQGMNRVFADLGDSVASAGELGIQVLGTGGTELFREQVRLSQPAVSAAGNRAVIYDKGGKALRVIDSGGVLVSQDAAGPIVSASINEMGWYCVVIQGTGVVKSVVTVYNDKGKPAYRCEIASGYVLDARLYRDNKSLAVLSVTDTGGKVSFYSRDYEDLLAEYEHDSEVILAFGWLPDGYIAAVAKSAVLIINRSGQGELVYEFGGRQLGGMCLTGGDFVALYLLDYGIGNDGRLVTLNQNGAVIAELATTDENIAMSLCGDTLAVLWDRGVTLYDSKLVGTALEGDGKPSDVLAVSGGRVLMIDPRLSRVAG